MEKVEILSLFSFFRESPPSLAEEMAAAAHSARLEAGQYHCHAGDPVTCFALVGAGSIRVLKAAESGREITLYRVGPGEACLVNILGAFLEGNSLASAVAQTDVEAVVVPAEFFREWLRLNDSFRGFIFEMMATRLVEIMSLVDAVAFRRMDVRLADYLLQHFSQLEPASQSLAITHEQIAGELGTAREVVSRILGDFDRSGAVRLGRGQITLRDEAPLLELRQREM